MANPFASLDSGLIGTFGEVAMGFDMPQFRPGSADTESIDGILTLAPSDEQYSPGIVAKLFVRKAGFAKLPVVKEQAKVRGEFFSIERIDPDDIGGLNILLRRQW